MENYYLMNHQQIETLAFQQIDKLYHFAMLVGVKIACVICK